MFGLDLCEGHWPLAFFCGAGRWQITGFAVAIVQRQIVLMIARERARNPTFHALYQRLRR